jgi:hypothetical protein
MVFFWGLVVLVKWRTRERFCDGAFWSSYLLLQLVFYEARRLLDNIATIKTPLVFSFQRWIVACSYSASCWGWRG